MGTGRRFGLFFATYPIFWLLGFSYFGWPLLAFLLLFPLVFGRRKTRIPPGTALWVGFLCFLGLAAFHLDASATVYLWRLSIWAGALLVFLYAFNLDEAGRNKAIAGLTVLWIGVVAGGLLGAVDPHGSISTIGGSLIPSSYASNSIVYSSIHPTFAQSSSFLGVGVPRPSAPFPYTNTWGAVFGLLLPCAWLRYQSASQRYRRVLVLVALLSFIPLVLSLDRGLWLSLAVAALFVLLRPNGGRSRLVAFRVVLPAAAVVLVLVLVTPLGGVIVDRFHHGQSNGVRVSLASSTFDAVLKSPLVGYGSPQGSHVYSRAQARSAQPEIGTQGTMWMVMISAGFPGLFFFYAFFLLALWRLGRAATRLPRAMQVMIVIFLVQTPFYDLLPVGLLIAMAGIGLAYGARLERADGLLHLSVAAPAPAVR